MKGNLHYIFILLSISLLCMQCQSPKDSKNVIENTNQYAKKFSAEQFNGYVKLQVIEPWRGAKETFTYYLYKEDSMHFQLPNNGVKVKVPIQNLVCMSTTHLPSIDMLNETEKLIGFTQTDYISSKPIRKRISEGKVVDLGLTSAINIELLLELSPDIIMAFGIGDHYDDLLNIGKTGTKVIMNADYMEETPLGRAEWIKFIAYFFDKSSIADSIFNKIADNYKQLNTLTKDLSTKPTILTDAMYGDAWYMPGGNSWTAQYIYDAGGNYLFADNNSKGSLPLSFEGVYEKGLEADFWINQGSYFAKDDLLKADSRYSLFKPMNINTVFNYSAQINHSGGNNYMELGFARPDLILKDLIYIFHPELIDEHELFFYQHLK